MTIAACYVCSEGVVFGADSTATFPVDDGSRSGHYYNYTQKLFEVGEGTSLAMVTAGIGGLGPTSFRTLIAHLADSFSRNPPASVKDAAWQWSSLVWGVYCSQFGGQRSRVAEIASKGDHASEEEKEERAKLIQAHLAVFCIGGCCGPTRLPEAMEVWLSLDNESPAEPRPVQMGNPRFWGWSNIVDRVIVGLDQGIFNAILNSGKWQGTPDDLVNVVVANKLAPPGMLPLRDAIDWVYSSIYTTIKVFKFSLLDPVCGGPIEIATITTDRRFRWVKHKHLDAAITQH